MGLTRCCDSVMLRTVAILYLSFLMLESTARQVSTNSLNAALNNFETRKTHEAKKNVTECRWSPQSLRIDCKLVDISALGGLGKIARREARILDLSFCRINDTRTLFEGLKKMPLLTEIFLNYNSISEVAKNLFWRNRRLRLINLHGNRISELEEETFWRNPVLNVLKMSQNRIKNLPPRLLFRSRRLRSLELWENKITTIPFNFFVRATSLQYLSLSWNEIKNLPPQLFYKNRLLKTVKLMNNKLWCVSTHQFERNQELRKINLGFNQLISLPSSTFQRNSKLQDLRMWSNRMECIPKELFHYNNKLSYVNLAGQRSSTREQNMKHVAKAMKGKDIEDFKKELESHGQEWCDDKRKYGECQWDANKRSFNCESLFMFSFNALTFPCDILHLNLASNEINDTNSLETLFQFTPDLITLVLSENDLRRTSGATFHQLRKLQKLNLSGNNMRSLPWDTFRKSRYLREIDLSRNSLTEMHANVFFPVTRLRKLNLAHNNYEELAGEFFIKNEQLQEIYLNNNRIIGLPDELFATNKNLLKLDVSFNNLEYISPAVLKRTLELQEINLRENKISEIEERLFRNLLHLSIIDLSNNHLEHLPYGLFKENEYLKKVHLNGNQLYKVSQSTFQNNPALMYLSLDNNLLAGVPEKIFLYNKNLEALGLQYNCISYIPQNLFKNNPRLKEVGLRGNPTLPRELRRVFEGMGEIRDLRKQLRIIEEELEATETAPTIETVEEPTTIKYEEVENFQEPRMREDGNFEYPDVDSKHIGIPFERWHDETDDKNVVQGERDIAPVGGEEVSFQGLQHLRGGNSEEKENGRSERSVSESVRKRVRRKRSFVLQDFVEITVNLEEEEGEGEEGLRAVCMKAWEKNGLI